MKHVGLTGFGSAIGSVSAPVTPVTVIFIFNASHLNMVQGVRLQGLQSEGLAARLSEVLRHLRDIKLMNLSFKDWTVFKFRLFTHRLHQRFGSALGSLSIWSHSQHRKTFHCAKTAIMFVGAGMVLASRTSNNKCTNISHIVVWHYSQIWTDSCSHTSVQTLEPAWQYLMT